MEENEEVFIKDEILTDEEPLVALKEPKLEQDVPEYVNVNLFANINNKIEKTENEMHQCNQCPRKYKRIEYLTIHYAIHDRLKLCPVCNDFFPYKSTFRCHLNQHIKDAMAMERKKAYVCDYCQKNFACKKSLVVHIRVHTNERPYKCEICGEAFKQLGSLKAHYVTHTKERRFVCEICNGSYTTGSSLRRHKRKIHDKGKVLRCTTCDAKMYNMADFKNHKINAHPDTGYKRTCLICSEVFYSKGTYRQHEQIHCQKNIKEKKYVGKTNLCLMCGEVLVSHDAFIDHRRIHLSYSKEELEEAKEKRLFKCKLCTSEFKKEGILFTHMGAHMKPNCKCEDCGNLYSYFRLRVHKRDVHHRVQCEVCQKECSGRRSLKYHYEKYHPSIRKKYNCRGSSQGYNLQHETRCMSNLQEPVSNLTARSSDGHLDKYHIEQSKSQKAQNKQRKYFRCRSCKKIFNLVNNYKSHVASNSCVAFIDNVRRKRKCNICFKYLASRVTLVRHMELHSDYNYECRICSRVYKQSETIKRHMRLCHPGEKTYWCVCCKQGFDNLSQFRGHNIIHGKMWEPPNGTGDCADSDFIKNEVIEIKEEPELLAE